MSGQRVRGADSGAACLTTPSHALSKEAAAFKGRGGDDSLECPFRPNMHTKKRESQELFSFTPTDAVETASVEASLGRIITRSKQMILGILLMI